MAFYKRPMGDGTQLVMDWDDYIKHGFKEELATSEPMPKVQKLAYVDLTKKEMKDE